MKNNITITLATLLALNLAACGPKTDAPVSDQVDSSTSTTMINDITTGNVLLDTWQGPYGGVPPWDKVDVSILAASLTQGIEMAKAEITAIANNPAQPTFDQYNYTLGKIWRGPQPRRKCFWRSCR